MARATLLALVVLAGCSGVTPGGPIVQDNELDAPSAGVLSGPTGEFVLIGGAPSETEAERAPRS